MAQARKNNVKPIKIIIVLVITLSLYTLSGCWSSKQLQDQQIVVGVGIDKDKEGKIEIAVQVVQPIKVAKKEDVPFIVFSSKGETAFEAIGNFTLVIGRELLWSHLQLIIIGPNIVKQDLVPFLDYFFRDHDARLKPIIFFTNEPVVEILKLPSPFEPISPFRVKLQIEKIEQKLSFTPNVKLFQFANMMLTSDGIGYLPIIKKAVNQGYPLISTEGMAVFKDGKRIGDLNKNETRGVLLVQNKVKGGIIVISDKNEEKDKNKISMEILGSTATVNPVLKGGNLSVTFDIESTMNINEIIGSFDIPYSIENLEKSIEEELKKEIKASLKKTQKWKADIYEINDTVHRKYTDYWQENKNQWDKIFSELEININVEVNLINHGFLKNSLE